jgi:hypothetical protein
MTNTGWVFWNSQTDRRWRAFTDQTSSRVRCGTCGAALMTRAVRAGHLIQAKGIGPSISTRNGVPMSARVSQTQRRSIQRNLRCPRAYLAREWARWTRTPDEVTNRPDESPMTCGCEWKEMRGTGDEDWWSASEYSKQARLGTNDRTPCSYFNGNSEQITGIVTLEPRPPGSDRRSARRRAGTSGHCAGAKVICSNQ